MSLKLSSYPVTKPASDFLNVFAGFQDVDLEFKREDQAINSVTSGTDSKAKCNLPVDLSSVISVGDSVYVSSSATNFTYDGTGEVLEVDGSSITVDIDFIEVGSAGYINYLKNWFTEIQIVSNISSSANLLGITIENAGKPNGEVKYNLNIANDKNIQQILTASGDISDSRIVFEVKFRQVYTGSSEAFVLIDTSLASAAFEAGLDATTFEQIVVVYSTEALTQDVFVYDETLPIMYVGYPAFVDLLTSELNHVDAFLTMNYQEADINQNIIGGAGTTLIATFSINRNGSLIGMISDYSSLDASTKYLSIQGLYTAGGDFAPGDFATPDFTLT